MLDAGTARIVEPPSGVAEQRASGVDDCIGSIGRAPRFGDVVFGNVRDDSGKLLYDGKGRRRRVSAILCGDGRLTSWVEITAEEVLGSIRSLLGSVVMALGGVRRHDEGQLVEDEHTPFMHNGRTWFRLNAIEECLAKIGLRWTRRHLCKRLQEMGAVCVSYHCKKPGKSNEMECLKFWGVDLSEMDEVDEMDEVNAVDVQVAREGLTPQEEERIGLLATEAAEGLTEAALPFGWLSSVQRVALLSSLRAVDVQGLKELLDFVNRERAGGAS